jgi:nitroreductase
METLEAIRTNRTVREFRREPLSDEHLQAILQAGRRSGSSKNTQPWAFIVVRDDGTLRRLSTVGDYASHLAGAAVGIALVGGRRTDGSPRDEWDLGRCAQNMTLAAWDLGIGSAPATVYRLDDAAAILGLPEDRICHYILSFGYPADPADLTRPLCAGGRRPLEEFVHQERW